MVASTLAQQGYDAVVALGVVIRGGTPHFEYVCAAATDGLNRVALDHGVAVGFGLLTCDTEEQALARAGYDAVVALGVVIRGGTPHFEYVCSAATDGLTRVALDHQTAIGFGVLTCDTEEQALDRAGLTRSREDKGYDAAAAALTTAQTLRSVRRGYV